jgi:mannose-1-phosphate guanylyltransferase
MTDHLYAVIMAGGGGTRLWPLSRKSSPKQLIPLFSKHSLFQVAVDRLKDFIPAERIYVVTIKDQVKELKHQEPSLPDRNFLIEPKPRGTAAVVAMAAAAMRKVDKDSVLAILTADHLISNITSFHKYLAAAYQVAQKGYIATLGIKPTFPATGYGYIESGDSLGSFAGIQAYKVKRFVEKPDESVAEELVKKENMTWNSGMFITKAQVMLDEFNEFMPDLSTSIDKLEPLLGEDHARADFLAEWTAIKPQTIDYGIMERTSLAAVLPAKCLGWYDVGSWDSFFDVVDQDENGNIVVDAKHIGIDTSGTLIVSNTTDQLVVTLGLKDFIIVQTPDAILICPRGESQRVKELVNYLKENNYTPLL